MKHLDYFALYLIVLFFLVATIMLGGLAIYCAFH